MVNKVVADYSILLVIQYMFEGKVEITMDCTVTDVLVACQLQAIELSQGQQHLPDLAFMSFYYHSITLTDNKHCYKIVL